MNGIIVIDKPAGYTSHDVVARLRGLLRERRVGHGGTLDPMATGVLPVLVGRATRASEYLLGDKEYVAEAVFGIVTDTQDITGAVLAESPLRPARTDVERALSALTGEIWQTPPMMSAVKINGQKLYRLARKGVAVDRPARRVTVHSLTPVEMTPDGCTLRARVSKGTYIRTLIHDLGEMLGCGAALSGLRRTHAEPFSLDDAVTLEAVAEAVEKRKADALLRPVDTLFARYPALTAAPEEETRYRNGGAVTLKSAAALDSTFCRVYGGQGEFLLLGRVEAAESCTKIYTEKSFFEVEKKSEARPQGG